MGDDLDIIKFAHIDRYAPAPVIHAAPEPLGEYSIENKQLVVGTRRRWKVKDEFIGGGDVDIDLKCDEHSNYKYPSTEIRGAGFAHKFITQNPQVLEQMRVNKEFEAYDGSTSKIVCPSYVLKNIDEMLWGNSQDFILMAKKDGDAIYIDFLGRTQDGNTQAAYVGLKFGDCVTYRTDSNEDVENTKPWAFENSHNVLYHVMIAENAKKMVVNLAIATPVRAFDDNGGPITIHTKMRGLDEKFWLFTARRWWLSAKLCGAKRAFYGIRDETQQVKKVGFIGTDALLPVPSRQWRRGPDNSIRLIANVLHNIRRILHNPGDNACYVRFYKKEKMAQFVTGAPVDGFFDPNF